MPNHKVTIKIPRRLYVKIQQLITDSGFNSATDFIVYVLRDVLSESGKPAPDPAAGGGTKPPAGATGSATGDNVTGRPNSTGTAASPAPAEDESEEFSPEELKALKQKLRNLGYLD